MAASNPKAIYQVVVVAPVFDDAVVAARLLENLATAFAGSDVVWSALLVDDGSPIPLARQLCPPAGVTADVLRLRRNVGHQRAIALGAAYVQECIPCDAMLVMDADGEDRPEDAVALVVRCRERAGERIIFAERTRRSESALFQLFYRLYQVLHWMLTGVRVRVGNFSVVPRGHLAALVTLPALWNHYAAAIFQARLPRELIPTARGLRYSGRSKMNFVALVVHGLQAISVFLEVVAVRLLLSVCALVGGTGALLAAVLLARMAGGFAVAAWMPYLCGGLFLASLGLAFGCFALTLGSLAQRNRLDFLPVRDYRLFVEGIQRVSAERDAPAEFLTHRSDRTNDVAHSESALRP